MFRLTAFAAGASAILLGGCVSYPVYQPAPIARLPADQLVPVQPLTQGQQDQLARDNAQVQRDDQADVNAQRQAAVVAPYGYVYPYAYDAYPYYPYYGYPYYGGFYPWAPGLSLSFGYFGGYRGGYRGYGGFRGGFHGRR